MSRETDKHHFFWKSNLSQWSRSPIKFESPTPELFPDVEYWCAEQYMMHHKAMIMGDFETAELIMLEKQQYVIKQLGRKVKYFDQKLWDTMKIQVVRNANYLKFKQNKEHKEALFKTYPKLLVEANPYDSIWGVGLDENNPLIDDENNWKGENLLGKILTEVRDSLMKEEGLI